MYGGKSTRRSNTDIYFTFTVELTVSNLWQTKYSDYQQFLYDTITGFVEINWNYQEIADWLNENNYKTTRGKQFFNSSCQSIVKKKNRRDARLNKKYHPKLSNFAISFVEKTLINSSDD